MSTETCDNLDFLFSKGGSSGGARPKILTKVDGEDWIIKFPSSYDSKDIGRQEYDYAMCAKECGIAMENVRLFSSERTKGYLVPKDLTVLMTLEAEEFTWYPLPGC